MSFHSHNRYRQRVSFNWTLPSTDPAWNMLIGAIRDVRAVAGQDGVVSFLAEWRRRGFLECSDEDAKKLENV